jgi:hypothetical protein
LSQTAFAFEVHSADSADQEACHAFRTLDGRRQRPTTTSRLPSGPEAGE